MKPQLRYGALRRVLLPVTLVLWTAVSVRGTSWPQAEGTGAVSGVVVDGVTGRGVPESIVTVDAGRGTARSVLTDANGRFAFADIAQGVYVIVVQKFGYEAGGLGVRTAATVNNSRIEVRPRQWVRDVRITLSKHAAVAGRVVDADGAPATGVSVSLFRRMPIAGRIQLVAASAAKTDDRGVFRFGGLSAGTYLIAVQSVQSSLPITSSGVRRMLASGDAKLGALAESASGLDVRDNRLLFGQQSQPPRLVGGVLHVSPTVYYPGVLLMDEAQPITLAPGDDTEVGDLGLQFTRGLLVAGHLDGALPEGCVLRLVPVGTEDRGVATYQATTLSRPDGRFAFVGVPPGSYVIDAGEFAAEFTAGDRRLGPAIVGLGTRPGGGRTIVAAPTGVTLTLGDQRVFARRTVVHVEAVDVEDIVVPLTLGQTIEGFIRIESSQAPRVLFVTAEPANGGPRFSPFSPVAVPVEPRPTFAVEGLGPRDYYLRVIANEPFVVRSVTANGQDYTNRPFDLSAGSVHNIEVTLTDQGATLVGSVRDGPKASRPDFAVIVFPVAEAQWSSYGYSPRAIKSLSRFQSSDYAIVGLPRGDYFVIALDANRADAWLDSESLRALSAHAERVSLEWGENLTQDLTIFRGSMR